MSSSKIGNYSVKDMENFILKNYGDKVSWAVKSKDLVKFGNNEDLGNMSLEDVWSVGGVEDLPTDNVITHIASTDLTDTQEIMIEGHTIDPDGNLTFLVQSVTLAGQTKTAIPIPLARSTRMYNNNSSDLAGVVYLAKDVSFTAGVPASDIHLNIPLNFNQSQKSASSTQIIDYWVIDQGCFSVRKKQDAVVDFFIQVREKGKVFRVRLSPISASQQSGTVTVKFPQPIIVPPNSDLRVQAISTATGTEVAVSLHGTLLTKI